MHIDLTATGSRTLLLALFSAFVVLLHPLASASQATPVKTANASCAKCHLEIYKKYLATPMANASGLAAEKLIPGNYVHKSTAIEYKVALAGGQATLSHQAPGAASKGDQLPLNYFLGSGHLGTTYLYSIDKFLFESPIAWYADLHGYDMKPGLADMQGLPPSLPMQSGCLRCHMSAVQPSETGTLNRYGGLPFLHTGITCEACHGDAQTHVNSGGKAGVVNPSKLNADQRDSVCISCHLEGDVTVERSGASALDYKPGESISKYLAYYVYGGADPTSRGVSEVEQFAKSTCRRVSGEKMSCSSCHDPHFTPSAQQRTSSFRGKCLACHNEPKFAASHHPEDPDCTSCHMMRTGSQNIPHVAWTDHRILRTPDSGKPDVGIQPTDELAPIFSPGATPRDLAMAYYLTMLEGNRASEPRAWEQLSQATEQIQGDVSALDALGVMHAERSDNQAAERIFRQVLALSPNDLTALSDLGTLLAKQGKLKEAATLLHAAFQRNADISGLAMNLARVECMQGDPKAARESLESTLTYNPDLASVRRLLNELSECGTVEGR
jgi:predicted CXXCH cytochrome family protein